MWNGKFKYIIKKCPICEKEFKCPLFRDTQKYCSRKCCFKSKEWLNKICSPKGTIFSKERNLKISKALKGKVRTKQHSKNISLAKKDKKWTNEQKKVKSKLYKKLFQEGKIKMKIMRGKDNPNWKGGITEENHKLRTSAKFAKWREKVFQRDNYTCQKCGDNKGGNLHPHHIKYWAKFPKYRFIVSNGLTLCKNCHINIHKKKYEKR